ncbi:aKG-HExxH-type peptide beta-hydroxylase [Streptomyces sp. NBC_00872]|uniref:aKG-HExxH-type peptide beta-hydroxylase n=1 Tax=Streptomyces sp. NBC_00872 TaxID=2903686 RepID=UPI003868B85F|nr:HEXXH motif-containing putative peptide modification protein [Streptomyces sp. NBC_00872]
MAQLAAAVIAVRQQHGQEMNLTGLPAADDFTGWLTPEVAVRTRPQASPVPSRPITPVRTRSILKAAAQLAGLVPAWRPLLSLPVTYRLLEVSDRSLSASTYLWPQHILLSDAAFDSQQALAELLLHEQCHQWLYLIEELWPLDLPDARRVALPSGTPNRAPREIIGAAHVAAATVRMYRAAGPNGTGATERIAFFAEYGRGCITLLDGLDSELTDTGSAVARHLQEAL